MHVIESERLVLRPLQVSDATQVYADWLNDPAVNQFLETRHEVQTVESCRAFIQQCNAGDADHLFGIFSKDTGEHIGNTKLGFIHPQYLRGQLSLFIGAKAYWNKGLASEVVKAMTHFGFVQLGLNRIEAGCYEGNLASLRIFLKAGYTVEGFLRNHVISNGASGGCFWLGILKNEWR